MTSLTISTIKKHEISTDGSVVTFAVDAKHVGELSMLIPAACYDELISAVSRAKAVIDAKQPRSAGQVKVKMAQNCLVTAEVQQHGLVVLVFDRQTPAETGYALNADTAKKLAVGLVKSADAVLMSKGDKKD
jgi:hypothetical protein